MALEVVVLDKDEYKALIDNQADKDVNQAWGIDYFSLEKVVE